MAKIKYLINNDPYESMVEAIKSENILYSRFYTSFKECWGRLSVGYFGNSWNSEMAKKTVDGIEVFGNKRIYLFSDFSIDDDGMIEYKYTKQFCLIVGADYEAMRWSLGDVENYYVDLSGVGKNIDFSNETLIQNSMNNIKAILNTYEIDTIKVSFVLDTEFDTNATSAMTLSQIRDLAPQLDYNSGDYFNSVDGFAPVVKYYGLPTYDFFIEEIYEIDPTTGEFILDGNGNKIVVETIKHYYQIDATEVAFSNYDISQIFSSLIKYSSYLDQCFASVNLSVTTLPSRTSSQIELPSGEYIVYDRYEYTIELSFDSYVEFITVDSVTTASLKNFINWDYLSSSNFSTPFATEYIQHLNWYESNTLQYEGIEYRNLTSTPHKNFLMFSSIISYLDNYGDVNDIFYNKIFANGFVKIIDTYLRFERVEGIQNKDFSDLMILSIYFGYTKEETGWFGGSFFGKVLEGIFTVVVGIVGILAAITGNVWLTAIIIGVLFVGSNYTGMSANSIKNITFITQVISAISIVYNIYNIYDIAYELSVTQAVSESSAQSIGVEATKEISVEAVLSNLTTLQKLELFNSFYGAFQLLSPTNISTISENDEMQESEELDTYIQTVDSAYSFYDEIYDIYN